MNTTLMTPTTIPPTAPEERWFEDAVVEEVLVECALAGDEGSGVPVYCTS